MGQIIASPLVGANTDRRTTNAEFKVGTPCLAEGNRTYVYVGPSTNAITAAAACTVTGAFVVNNTAGTYTADTAFATGDYGWVRKTTSPL
jgi:hypothetical protein